MSGNPLTAKVATPYARALFDFSVEKNIMHQITADFQNLDVFLEEASELTEYLNNPVVKQEAKREIQPTHGKTRGKYDVEELLSIF